MFRGMQGYRYVIRRVNGVAEPLKVWKNNTTLSALFLGDAAASAKLAALDHVVSRFWGVHLLALSRECHEGMENEMIGFWRLYRSYHGGDPFLLALAYGFRV